MSNYCGKCNQGTIIIKDPTTGEEYTDYCPCRLQKEESDDLLQKLQQARVPKDYWNLGFDNYVNPANTRKEQIVNNDNIQITNKYIANLEENIKNGRGLYFTGGNNSGKTMLMCIVLKEAIKKGFNVCFFTMSEVINWYMSSWFDTKELKKDISFFKECDLLGIDDCFDRTKTYVSANNMQVAQIDDLFRYRVHNWKSFLVTANIAKNDIASTSMLNANLLNLLNRKTLELVFYGNVSDILQTKLRKEIIDGTA